jgi:hypothetical protein
MFKYKLMRLENQFGAAKFIAELNIRNLADIETITQAEEKGM